MQHYKDFTEGVLHLIKRKIKKGVQILTDLLEVLINKEKEIAKAAKNEQLNKKLTDPNGENEDKKTKALREKKAASDK
jgi:23S rRNA maturation mini-RNase III